MLEGIETNYMVIIGPVIVLFIALFVPALIVKLIFGKFLPKVLYDLLLGAALLFGLYLWLIPMNGGFSDFFR